MGAASVMFVFALWLMCRWAWRLGVSLANRRARVSEPVVHVMPVPAGVHLGGFAVEYYLPDEASDEVMVFQAFIQADAAPETQLAWLGFIGSRPGEA